MMLCDKHIKDLEAAMDERGLKYNRSMKDGYEAMSVTGRPDPLMAAYMLICSETLQITKDDTGVDEDGLTCAQCHINKVCTCPMVNCADQMTAIAADHVLQQYMEARA